MLMWHGVKENEEFKEDEELNRLLREGWQIILSDSPKIGFFRYQLWRDDSAPTMSEIIGENKMLVQHNQGEWAKVEPLHAKINSLTKENENLQTEIETLKTKLAPEIPLETELRIANLSVQSLSDENIQLKEQLETSQGNYRKLEAYLHEKTDEIETLKTEIAFLKGQVKLDAEPPRLFEIVRYSEFENDTWVIKGYYWQADEIRKKYSFMRESDTEVVVFNQKWEFIQTIPEQRYDMTFLDLPF